MQEHEDQHDDRDDRGTDAEMPVLVGNFDIMPVVMIILAMGLTDITLIMIIVALTRATMRVTTQSQGYKNKTAMIVVGMEIVCTTKTMNVTIPQWTNINLFHRVLTQKPW